MSKVALSGNVLGTGTVTLAAPNTASDVTLTLPAVTAELITNSSGVLDIGSGQLVKDASGNLGLGVTPSAWDTLKAFDVGSGGALWGTAAQVGIASNAYYGSGGFRYKATNVAAALQVDGSVFKFLTAPSGTAGDAISFTQAMTLDASGRLGIGTTSLSSLLTINAEVDSTAYNGAATDGQLTAGATQLIRAAAGANTNVTQIVFQSRASQPFNRIVSSGGSAPFMAFATNNAERARIDSSGRLLVGTTTAGFGSQNGFSVMNPENATYLSINHANGTTSTATYIGFAYNGATIGSVTQSGTTAVAYNTSSDYRLKENVAPMTGALEKVAALKPVTYTWKADGSAGQGFIAHELQEVVPDCVTGEKDAVDADGNPQYQGVDTSFLVATLVSAIQELTARLEVLENK